MVLDDVSVVYSETGFFSETADVVALSGISVRVAYGDKLGVLGANGAGKSTLLRVMAGVLKPNIGSVDFEGMSSAFLSLQAGFDSELSGARNIIMHGMLMGLTLKQAQSRVSAVAKMSGLGTALKRRVSTYSTGMRARLCFCTAINLDPDVLLLDEIFSVGDREFRATSERIMLDRFKQEKAVVFVSHNVAMIERVCERAIWLDNGRIRAHGDVGEIAAAYRSEKT